MRAVDIPLAIQWHDGMLLSPQHFQEADRRSERLLAYHAGHAAQYHWGVVHLELDLVHPQRHVLRRPDPQVHGLALFDLHHDTSGAERRRGGPVAAELEGDAFDETINGYHDFRHNGGKGNHNFCGVAIILSS